MRHVLILNPAAGKTDSTLNLADEARAVFSKMGASYNIEVTGFPGHAEQIAKRYRDMDEEAILYACGGDGTLFEVSQALYNAPHLTLAPVAIGTGNDFVRTISENYHDFSITELAENGCTVSADILLAGGKVALNIVSVGLDAAIANNVSRFKRLPMVSGSTAYYLSTAYCLLKSIKYRFDFEVDGKMLKSCDSVFAVAANGRFYGGGFKAAPIADIQDGLIDFIRIPAMPKLSLIPMIGSYRRGEHLDKGKYDFIEFIRCRKVRIISREPVDLNCDGEVFKADNPTVEIVPGGIKLLLPKKYADLGKNAKAQPSDEALQKAKV